MRLLWFYVSHTFVNSLRKLFKTWVAIVLGIIVLAGIIGFVAGIVASNISELSEEQNSSGYEQTAPDDGEDIDDDDEALDIDPNTLHTVLEIGVGAISLLLMLGSFYFSDKQGADIFTMPDVNFLFPAPMKPQSILLFRTVLKMGLLVLGSAYLLFQLPTLVRRLGLDLYSAIMIIVAWIAILILCQMISVFTYTFAATKQGFRKLIRPLSIFILLGVLAGIAGQMYLGKLGFWRALVNTFASKYGRWIPIWGWVRGLVMSAIEGHWLLSALFLALLTIAICAAAYFIWKMKVDFYEDALAGAAELQNIEEKAEEKSNSMQQNRKRKNAEKKAGEFGRGQGAQMFLVKDIYNRRRFAKLGLFSNTSLLYLVVCGCFAIVQRFWIKSTSITLMSGVLLVMIFFRNIGNPIALETGCPYLFTIPEKSAAKLYYCLLAGLHGTAWDITPIYFAAVLLMNGNLFTALLWLLLFISFDLISTVSGLLQELALPESLHPVIRFFLQFILKMWPVLPNVIILVGVRAWLGMQLALPIAFIFNFAFAAALFAFCPSLLHRGRN